MYTYSTTVASPSHYDARFLSYRGMIKNDKIVCWHSELYRLTILKFQYWPGKDNVKAGTM